MKRTRNKIFRTYLISYILIGIFPLVLSLVGYKVCQNIITEEIKTSQNNILTQIQTTFNHYMESIVVSGQLLGSNSRLNELSEAEAFDPQDRLELKKLRDELMVQKNSLELCGDIVVYLQKSNTVVTNEKVYSNEMVTFYEQMGGIAKESMERALALSGVRGCIVGESQNGEPLILFVENVYNYNYKEKIAVIMISMPWKNVQEKSGAIKNGAIYWINESGDWLAVGEMENPPLDYDLLKREGDLIYTGEGNRSEISSFRKAQYYDWKYCITMMEKYYFAELNRLRIVILVQMAALAAVAVALALFCSWQNYKPIARILSAVKKNQRNGQQADAFSDVEEYIEKLYMDNQKLGRSWERAKDILAGQAVTGYLKGWNTDGALVEETLLGKADICLDDGYMVFLITLQDISACKLFLNADGIGDAETKELLRFIFFNIFHEIVLVGHRGTIFEMDDMYLCILQAKQQQDPEAVIEIMKQCCDAYKAHMNLSVFVGASSRHGGVEELQQAYNEAVQVLAYQSFWGSEGESLVIYENTYTPDSACRGGSPAVGVQRRLYNLMASKEYEKAAVLLEEIIDDMLIRDIGYTEVNQCRMFGLVNTVCMYLEELMGRDDEAFLAELHPMERLLQAKSAEAAKKALKEVFGDIVRHLEECLDNERPGWVNEIIQYVESNYQDVNLNVSMLAEKMNRNLAYIGRTFKQYVGCSLPDYIHMVRIRECKALLRKGVSVKDAAELVGYVDSKSLIRAFKKQEGITPGQFKNG